jgi:heat shock protein HtpX
MFSNAVLLALSLLPWAIAQAMIHLLYRDSQRAEYLADRLTAQVSSIAASLSALEKMYLTDTFMLSVRRSALNSSTIDFFAEFRQRVKNLPPRESERIRRAEQLHGSRLNMTHPPTVYRIEALTTLPMTTPQVTYDEDTAHQIEQELMSFCAVIDRELKRHYEASLYG